MHFYTIPEHRRGDTWDGIPSITISLSTVAGVTPINLSGAEVRMDFRYEPDTPPAISFSSLSGTIVILDPAGGNFQIPARMIEIPYQTYNYDLQVNYPTGVVKTHMTGTWKIVADYTT